MALAEVKLQHTILRRWRGRAGARAQSRVARSADRQSPSPPGVFANAAGVRQQVEANRLFVTSGAATEVFRTHGRLAKARHFAGWRGAIGNRLERAFLPPGDVVVLGLMLRSALPETTFNLVEF
jgi:hypothetical protein